MGTVLFGLGEASVLLVALGASYVLLWRGAFRILHTPSPGPRSDARESSGFESGALGEAPPADGWVLDAWSYRVAARFAGRVRIVLTGDTITIAGPRVPRTIYAFWVWAQSLLLVGGITALVASLALWSSTAIWVAAALLALGVAVALIGAGLWPGLGEMGWVVTGRYDAVDIARTAVSDVRVGKGWSRGGFDEVLFLYRAGVDKIAEGRAVSFFAPDESGRIVRYAVHIHADEDVARLAAELAG